MLVEAFLTKIVAALLKKSAVSAIAAVGKAIEVYTVLDTLADACDAVTSFNDSSDLGIAGLQVISDPMSEAVANQLLSIGSDRYTVEKLSSGVYIASKFTPAFKAPLRFPAFDPPRLVKPQFRSFSKPKFSKL